MIDNYRKAYFRNPEGKLVRRCLATDRAIVLARRKTGEYELSLCQYKKEGMYQSPSQIFMRALSNMCYPVYLKDKEGAVYKMSQANHFISIDKSQQVLLKKYRKKSNYLSSEEVKDCFGQFNNRTLFDRLFNQMEQGLEVITQEEYSTITSANSQLKSSI